MSVYRDVLKKIAPFMKSKGFLRSGYSGKFYYAKNDIAYCITLEKPSCFVHVHAHIMPLYIPTDFNHLSYGNELRIITGLKFPEISEYEPEYIDEWSDLFCRTMEDTIIPLFVQINSPEKIAAEIELLPTLTTSLFHFIMPIHLETIKMYNYLYLQNIPETQKSINSYRKELVETSGILTKECYALFYERSNEVEALIYRDKDEREAFFKNTINHTKTFFKGVL